MTPEDLARDAGRRALALEILALMHVSAFEINEMMQKETSDVPGDL